MLRLITVVLVLLGVYSRFKGLGLSALAADEYYLANSINRIVQFGVPVRDCGGYYVRGILQQYLSAPFLLYGSNDEYYLRLIPVVFSIGAIYAAFLIGRLVVDETTGCVIAILLALSLWQIEFARFARMYAPFSALFLWTIYFCILDLRQKGKGNAKWWAILVAFITVFVYEGAIFAILLLFLVAIIQPSAMSIGRWCVIILLGLFAVAYQLFDFRKWGAQVSSSPEDQPVLRGLPIELPNLLFPGLLDSSVGLAGILCLGLPAVILTIVWLRIGFQPNRTINERWLVAGFIGALVLSLLNLFGLLAAFAMALALLIRAHSTHIDLRANRLLMIVTGMFIAFSLAFWIFVLPDINESMLLSGKTTNGPFTLGVKWQLFGYPDVQKKILWVWQNVMPVQVAVLAALMVWLVWRLFRPKSTPDLATIFLLIIVIVSALLMAVLKQPEMSTRYTFFLHAVLIILAGISLHHIACILPAKLNLLRLILPLALFVFISEDYNWSRLISIDSDKNLYRIGLSRPEQSHFYSRYDYRGIAQFVNEKAAAGDIVISALQPTDYYLKHLDYFYHERSHPGYSIIAACGGTRHFWSGVPLLSSVSELKQVSEATKKTIWFLAYWSY